MPELAPTEPGHEGYAGSRCVVFASSTAGKYNEKNHEDHANKYETKASVIHVKYIY